MVANSKPQTYFRKIREVIIVNPREIRPTDEMVVRDTKGLTDVLQSNSSMIAEILIDVTCIKKQIDGLDKATPDVATPSCILDEITNQAIALNDIRDTLKILRSELSI